MANTPTIGGLASASLPQALGASLGDASAKIKEGMGAAVDKLSALNPFKKAGADQLPLASVANMDALRKVKAAEGDLAALETPPAMESNALTDAEMQASVEAAIEADVDAKQLATSKDPETDQSHKVVLREMGTTNEVIFDIMPEVYESRSVEYEAVAPTQAPTAFQKYKSTAPVQWTVNATLTARTTAEATRNLRILNQLRVWTMPFFGTGTASTPLGKLKLGAPPPVLELSGWRMRMVGPVPVVMTAVNWTFPQDVDYIPANPPEYSSMGPEDASAHPNIPFPTVTKVTLNLVESYSTDRMNGFNRDLFALGKFEEAWPSVHNTFSTVSEPVKAADSGVVTDPAVFEAMAKEQGATPGVPVSLSNVPFSTAPLGLARTYVAEAQHHLTSSIKIPVLAPGALDKGFTHFGK